MTLTVKDLAHLLGEGKALFNSSEIITGLEFDSRKVQKGSVFFCIKGEKSDGHNFIKQALEAGAVLVVADKSRLQDIKENTDKIIFVDHVRKALGLAANKFFGEISSKIKLIGVTGTNGKTTTTHLLAQILSRLSSKRVGLVGTLGSKIYEKGVCIEFLGEGSGRTTPEAPELHGLFKQLYSKDCESIVMEVSSHSLEQGRVHGCDFKVAVFTNLTQDHLDYHLTMENYFEAKAILFKMLSERANTDSSSFAVLNADSSWTKRIMELLPNTKVITYSINSSSNEIKPEFKTKIQASIKASDVEFGSQSIVSNILLTQSSASEETKEVKVEIPLNGEFNLYNSLASMAVAFGLRLDLGFDFNKICKASEKVESAPGRFQLIPKPDSSFPTCIVDYAHTPDGLENVLKTAKQIVPKNGKLISVFGCGGDRDPTKRPIMGKISTDYADLTYVTSDNPRSEDPNQIVADIMSGIASLDKVEVEIDRAQAIERAILEANTADVVVIAGKGHEDYQIFADKTIHFLDSEEVEKAFLKRLKG